MTDNTLLQWLDHLVANYPEDRMSGWEPYEFVVRQCQDVIHQNREELIDAVTHWLARRREPYVTLALSLAAEYHLSELREPIEDLLAAVERGEAFKPYY
jgi:hypothetical protein